MSIEQLYAQILKEINEINDMINETHFSFLKLVHQSETTIKELKKEIDNFKTETSEDPSPIILRRLRSRGVFSTGMNFAKLLNCHLILLTNVKSQIIFPLADGSPKAKRKIERIIAH